MFKIILEQNRQTAKQGIMELLKNIKILENQTIIRYEEDTDMLKNKIEQYTKILADENMVMSEVDEILTFSSVNNELIINKFK